jgi:hypothetical protein
MESVVLLEYRTHLNIIINRASELLSLSCHTRVNPSTTISKPAFCIYVFLCLSL